MSDTQAAMREFRFLDDKRKTNGLTPQEEQRWYELAAQLGVDMSQYGQWGPDGQWYPYPPGYDPQAQWAAQQQQQYYDPHQQQAGWYPQQGYDPNQPAYDPNQPAYDPNQQYYDPNQQPQYDPNQHQSYDPNQAGYDPNQPQAYPPQPAYDPTQYPAAPYPQQQGWYGQPPQQPGYYDPNQAQPQPAYQQPAYQQPSPAWQPTPQPPAPTWQQPAPEVEDASDEVMEIGDDELSPIPTAPPPARSPAMPRLSEDPVADLRSALLDEESGTDVSVPVVPAPALPAMPLFGGAGFSKPSLPVPDRRVEATAVSALLPTPTDDAPLIDATVGTAGHSPETVTQLEVAAASAFSDGSEELSNSQVTEVADVEAALSAAELPDLPLLGDRALAPSPRGDSIDDGPIVDPTPSMMLDVPVRDDAPIIDPTPSMMLDVPPVAQPLRLDVPVAADAPVIDPTPSMMLEAPVAADAPVIDPTPSMMLEVPVAADAPVIAPTPSMLEAPSAQPLMLDVPVTADAPVIDPTPSMMLEVPVAADAPVIDPTPSMILEVPVAADERVIDPTPSMLEAPSAQSLMLDVPVTAEAPILDPTPLMLDMPVAQALPNDRPLAQSLDANKVAEPTPQWLDLPPDEHVAAPVESPFAGSQALDAPVATPTLPLVSVAEVSLLDVPALAGESVTDSATALLEVPVIAEPSLADAAVAPSPVAAIDSASPIVTPVEVPLAMSPAQGVDAAPEPIASPAVDTFTPPSLAEAPLLDTPRASPALSDTDEVPAHVPHPPQGATEQVPALVPIALSDRTPTPVEVPAVELPSEEEVVAGVEVEGELLPMVEAPVDDWSAPAALTRAPSAFDALAIPPPLPSRPSGAMKLPEVSAQAWEDIPTSPVLPVAQEWAGPAAPAPAPDWGAADAPAAASRSAVFATNWDNDASGEFAGKPDTDAALAGKPDDAVELASNADFIQPTAGDGLPALEIAVSDDVEPFEVESGPAASLATGVVDSPASSIDSMEIELASSADFIGAQALTSTGETWERTGPALDLEAPEPEGEIIQGIVVEEEPEPPAPLPLNTRVAVPIAPPPVATPAQAFGLPPRPPVAQAPVALPPVPSMAQAPIALPPAPRPAVVAPVVPTMPQPPPRALTDQLFDRANTVKASGPVVIRGDHRVILHTMEGQVKRGALKAPDLGAELLALEGPAGGTESIALGRVKAIFFMLAPGARSPAGDGQKVRVTFKDGRQVAGFSVDHAQGGPGFFVVPADNRTNTERIYIYRHGVQSISIER